MLMRRTLLAAMAVLAMGLSLSLNALAQPTPATLPVVAFPFYNAAHAMQGLHQHLLVPRAQVFVEASQQLAARTTAYCASASPGTAALSPVRQQWQATLQAWEALSSVGTGAVLARRSQRQIDFWPTRPALIERAMARQPQGEQAMALVGTPAKGLPALEWLLWTRPVAPGTPACRYAVEVARDIQREAQALQQAFGAAPKAGAAADSDAEGEVDEASVVAGSAEFVNQWVGGVERLRWAQMEKPLRAAAGRAPDWPRAASGSSVASWRAQWEALRSLGVFAGGEAPLAGQGLVPLETWLRSKGRNPEADRLVAAARNVDTRMQRIDPRRHATVLDAAKALAALKRVAEADVAPALEVSLGFSDADGD